MGTFWAQVAAQAITFGLFFWVLKRFAWGPTQAFLERRRDYIREQIEAAERQRAEAEASHLALEERLAKIEDEARQRIQEAAAAGRKAAEEITEQARQDAREIRNHAQQMAQIEFAKAMQQVKDDIVRMTLSATERLLREEMSGERQQRMVRQFLDQLEEKN